MRRHDFEISPISPFCLSPLGVLSLFSFGILFRSLIPVSKTRFVGQIYIILCSLDIVPFVAVVGAPILYLLSPPAFFYQKPHSIIAIINSLSMDYYPEKMHHHHGGLGLRGYVKALEEERRKIQVFQRELPLCLELVTHGNQKLRPFLFFLFKKFFLWVFVVCLLMVFDYKDF